MRIISGTARGMKLYTLEGTHTRPTLDRVKEPLFSILQMYIKDAMVLDLFSGSGALALEALSRGANKAILCDSSCEAVQVIKRNIEKTHMDDKAKVFCTDYQKYVKDCTECFDLIFLDPPYEANIAVKAATMVIEHQLLKPNGIIIIETDDAERELKQSATCSDLINVYDLRKYGRVSLIFLKREG